MLFLRMYSLFKDKNLLLDGSHSKFCCAQIQNFTEEKLKIPKGEVGNTSTLCSDILLIFPLLDFVHNSLLKSVLVSLIVLEIFDFIKKCIFYFMLGVNFIFPRLSYDIFY